MSKFHFRIRVNINLQHLLKIMHLPSTKPARFKSTE